MSTLTVSYSGVRGIVGESLTEDTARHFGRAFGLLLAERYREPLLLLGRDTRPSGEWITRCLLEGLAPFEPRIVDLGVVPTPTLQFFMGPREAQGGVVVTASHNPAQYNGFKFFLGPENTVLDHQQTDRLIELTNRVEAEGGPFGNPDSLSRVDGREEAIALHVSRVLEHVGPERIRARRFRVAVDSAEGAGAEPLPRLLEALGCEVHIVEAGRDSEPLPENLGELCRVVRENGYDVGFAQDLDADRLALIDERGLPVGEEFTLVLAVDHLLARPCDRPRVVVKNVSTTRALDAVVARAGAELVETRVGEVNLSRALHRQVEAGCFAFGGEGNGGVIFPPISLGRDSLAGAAFVLEHLVDRSLPLSVVAGALPHYHIRKGKVALASRDLLDPIYERVAHTFSDGAPDRLDGLRMKYADGSWLGLRPSNTEPIIRLVVESPSEAWADDAFRRLEETVDGAR